jgi:hypothetical protein
LAACFVEVSTTTALKEYRSGSSSLMGTDTKWEDNWKGISFGSRPRLVRSSSFASFRRK